MKSQINLSKTNSLAQQWKNLNTRQRKRFFREEPKKAQLLINKLYELGGSKNINTATSVLRSYLNQTGTYDSQELKKAVAIQKDMRMEVAKEKREQKSKVRKWKSIEKKSGFSSEGSPLRFGYIPNSRYVNMSEKEFVNEMIDNLDMELGSWKRYKYKDLKKLYETFLDKKELPKWNKREMEKRVTKRDLEIAYEQLYDKIQIQAKTLSFKELKEEAQNQTFSFMDYYFKNADAEEVYNVKKLMKNLYPKQILEIQSMLDSDTFKKIYGSKGGNQDEDGYNYIDDARVRAEKRLELLKKIVENELGYRYKKDKRGFLKKEKIGTKKADLTIAHFL